MAIGEHKRKSPYHGIVLTSFFMIAVPVGLYFLMRAILFKNQVEISAELNEASAKTIGLGVGFLFHMSLIIAGILEESFRVVIRRVIGFFDDLKFSFKIAWGCYVDDIRENGVAFWILFAIMVVNFCFFWSGLRFIIEYYLN